MPTMNLFVPRRQRVAALRILLHRLNSTVWGSEPAPFHSGGTILDGRCCGLMAQPFPRRSVTAIKLSRHTGMDCRYPEHREVNLVCPPWHLGSGNPCRNDVVFLN
ncbi:MAG: hypothetical protein NTX45_01050, partial [Proteobacteria bacterium]|nr:hypothetical protein [Pseudomonadota bacterium]